MHGVGDEVGDAGGDAAGKPARVGRSIDADCLAWTALLARWVEYARAATAIPPDAQGVRWRGAVEHVIVLQAVRMALDDIVRVPERDRRVARDVAAIQVRRAVAALEALWHAEPLPDHLMTLVAEAEGALRDAGLLLPQAEEVALARWTELVWQGGEALIMPEVVNMGGPETPGGTLLLMAPGTIAFPGEPVAIVAGRPVPVIEGAVARPVQDLSQLYRTFDSSGRWVSSFRQPVDDALPEAMPMLVPIWAEGQRVGSFELPAMEWIAMQRAAGIGPPSR